ncbi:hypothetical protein R3W88_020061 [Solanum pinnatisectum]|uniref:Uncharacterized protein n=1 Tax=Solanum pinnatisectum TaxID=50273 RepID=A0AAV9KNG6_9SOLN|nr:hypothetical protein R3W88_020061 [Solanum pinnatisectum]
MRMTGFRFLHSTLMLNPHRFILTVLILSLQFHNQLWCLPRVLKSSTSVLAFNTGSSQADHVFDELPVQYKYVESVALITKNNVEVEPLEDVDTPQLGNAKSVEANLEHEPSSIIEDQMLDEISHTTIEHSLPLAVLHDADGSYNDEKENSLDNVALFENFPPLNI